MRQSLLGCLFLALAMTCVGSSVVVYKAVAHELPVFLVSTVRFALAALILIPVALRFQGGWPRLPPRQWAVLLFQALCGAFLFNIFLILGVRYTSAMEAGIITGTLPAAIALLAVLVLRERLTARRAGGIGLAVAGAALLNAVGTGGDPAIAPLPILGNALILMAVLSEAAFAVGGKYMSARLHWTTLSAVLSVVGFAAFLPLGLIEAATATGSVMSADAWIAAVYLALVVTVLSLFLFYAGISRIEAQLAGVFTACMPLSAMALSMLVLGEIMTAWHALGAGLVVSAILLVTWPGGPARDPGPKESRAAPGAPAPPLSGNRHDH